MTDQQNPPPNEPPLPDNIEQCVDQFVRLRDKIKEAEDAMKAKLAPGKAYLERLNNHLLERLNAVGGESVRTPSGTVYRTTKRSASIADGDVFRKFVIDNQQFDMVDWKANALAVDDYIKSHTTTPPGVNFTMTYTVGVRRT